MQICAHSHIMSDLNITNAASTNVLDPGKVLETAEKSIRKGHEHSFDRESAVSCSWDDDDNDAIKGCEQENSETTNKRLTLLLDNQLEKMHIDSTDLIRPFSTRNTEIPKSSGVTQLNMQHFKAQNCQKINAEKTECNNVEKHDCDTYKNYDLKGSGASQLVTVQRGKPLLPPNSVSPISGNELSYILPSGTQSTIAIPSKSSETCCSKQNLPSLLKSQSLDLYNIDQHLHNHHFPNITEHRSIESQFQLIAANTDIMKHCQESRPIYPNVPYSPYASPYGSPRSVRRRPPLRESRRISIEKSGSFLQLNQYKLMDQIGQGSYGLVKLAYSEEDSTHYAMKILSKKRLLRQAAFMRRGPKQTTSPLDRVYREIAVLKKLDHPNVVKLVEVLDDPMEDSLYMVFELVKKGEVLSIPTEKPLSEERAWSVFRDCLLGLEYLHYQKIIHADLKPGNLLLTECGHVKIADLGVCNEFLGEDSIMSNGSTGGTPAFRAPETLALGKNVYCGRAADIWALGATLYSLIFGNVPFIANSIPMLYDKIRNDEVAFPGTPEISSDLRNCIARMLEKDPANRITLPQLKISSWVTSNGFYSLPTEDENCCLVQVDDEDINSVVRSIPKLDTLILIKTMLKNHSFGNPFMRDISGRAPQPGGSRFDKFIQAGRSNSAPGSYFVALDREPSMDGVLPALTEHCSIQKNNEF
ncbi:calcium/calmodulin-dependent protein kinase kinase 1 isoform X2 [Drosophila montana]|uniref:calcium/calmodulin-dependent protein kinase kinase 1 isoform X2 n=2 Tax=Drosophila montana TaxID=40370 RepID=UPI00313C03B8